MTKKKIVIMSGSETQLGTIALLQAADALGFDGDVAVVGEAGATAKLASADAVVYRIGPQSHPRYVAYAAELDDESRGPINALLRAFDKAASYHLLLQNNIPTPHSEVLPRQEVPRFYPVVAKILHGNQGIGVELINSVDEYHKFVERFPDEREFLLQEFIEEAAASDKRILVVGGKVVAAMVRRSTNGDFRANLHTGAAARGYRPSNAEAELAISATRAFELPYAGVDIINSRQGPLVLEVNPSPGFAIGQITGVDIAKELIKGVLSYD